MTYDPNDGISVRKKGMEVYACIAFWAMKFFYVIVLINEYLSKLDMMDEIHLVHRHHKKFITGTQFVS